MAGHFFWFNFIRFWKKKHVVKTSQKTSRDPENHLHLERKNIFSPNLHFWIQTCSFIGALYSLGLLK